MDTKAVAISGTVGKQVYSTTGPEVILRGMTLSPLSAAGYIKIRDGNSSGDIKYEGSVPANGAKDVRFAGKGVKFMKGMHVKVLGTGTIAYLWID